MSAEENVDCWHHGMNRNHGLDRASDLEGTLDMNKTHNLERTHDSEGSHELHTSYDDLESNHNQDKDGSSDDSSQTSVNVTQLCGSLPLTVQVDADIDKERRKVQNFSCNCKHVKLAPTATDPRKGCVLQWSVDELINIRMDWGSMSRDKKNNMLQGLLLGQAVNDGETTCRSRQKAQAKRIRTRTSYCYKGRIVCRQTFLFLLVISVNKLHSLKKHVAIFGAAPRLLKTWKSS